MRVLGNRILIKPHEVTSQGGIILTDAKKEKATVLGVGRGYFVNGAWEPMDVKVGDIIYFQGGLMLKNDIAVISEKDVLAIEEEGDQ